VVLQHTQMAELPVSLPPRPPLLAGREELLAELHIRLSAAHAARPRVVTLHGLGGAGKTSVAVEYAHRHLAEVRLAWQFSAEDSAVLAVGFGELAAHLGAQDVLETRNPVAAVHAVLAAFPAEWLLIFDNAPNRASVEKFLPPSGPGRVLITSQNQNWPPVQALKVPTLGTEVAAEFLIERTGDPDRQAGAELAREMGGLPLALEQAAAYIQATGDGLARYLASFRQRRTNMLNRGEPTGYRGTVLTAWALAFARLEQSTPEATGLLRLLAYCAPEPVPLSLLLQPRPAVTRRMRRRMAKVLKPLLEDPLAATDAVAALRQYSLVSPAAGGAVSVHRLVQVVTIDQIPKGLDASWRQAAAAMIEAAIPKHPEQPETWPKFAALLPHVQAALAADSRGMELIADYLGYTGNYLAARDQLRRVIEARAGALGPDHPVILGLRSRLAHCTAQAGDPAEARDQIASLLPVVERVFGAKNRNTVAFRVNLASYTGLAGDPAGARDQCAALLPVAERVFGAEDPNTLILRGNLAGSTGKAGDPAGARDQYAALLPICERVIGPDHPETLTIREGLADWTGKAGDLAGARDQYAAILPIHERILGPDHPDNLSSRAHLADWIGHAGDPAGARDQYAALLLIRERVLGPDNLESLNDRNRLAHWTGEAGDPAKARDQCAALVTDFERVLGRDHSDTLIVRTYLAHWTAQAGDPAGGRDQYAALLPQFEQVLGREHPYTMTVRTNLAIWTGEAGDPAKARDQCAALVTDFERILGRDHSDTLTARALLDHWTSEAGNRREPNMD
jgi:hypothetical protein